MVTLGQILGTVVGFPLLVFLVNLFYFSNKYNDDAEQYYKEYMNNSYDIEVTMPEEKSKYYLENQDENIKRRIQRANALHRKVIKSFRKNTQKEYKNLIFLLVED